ncbi:MAG: hypothetical protein WKF78_07790 [Candidatus Limnocylindrales bacterium]
MPRRLPLLLSDGWRLILMAMAGLLSAALLLSPTGSVVRKDRRP